MVHSSQIDNQQIQEFVNELSDFANTAEVTLKKIEDDLEGNKHLFSIFFERMFAIRGTAQQLSLHHIAKIASLGEEISAKGPQATSRSQIRKCVGSLWDALTTIKYLLQHYTEETNEEQNILIHRLESTLKSLGGGRKTLSNEEIAAFLSKKK